MNIPVANPTISQGRPRPILEAGTYPARIVQVIDLGTSESNYQGKPSIDRVFAIRFETPDAKAVFSDDKGEQPYMFTVNAKFKITSKDSQMKSTLDKIIMAIGETPTVEFNIFSLLDKTLLIEVAVEPGKNGGEFNTVTNFSKLIKGMQVSPRANDLKWLYLEPEYFDSEVFENLGEKTREKIKLTPEYARCVGKHASGPTMSTPSNQPVNLPDVDEVVEEAYTSMPF